MTTSLTAVLAALALAQADPVAPPTPTTTSAPPAPEAPALAGPRILPALGLVPAGAPVLVPGVPVHCLYGPSGTFRAQCDERARRCLVRACIAGPRSVGHPR